MRAGDNIGGGSAADSTFILAEAIAQGISSYLQSMFDPDAALACESAGIGAVVDLSLGAHTDGLHGEPLAVQAKVRALSDGLYENPSDMPTHGGAKYFDAGLCGTLYICYAPSLLIAHSLLIPLIMM
jgi:microcystin degradation protein MlrC